MSTRPDPFLDGGGSEHPTSWSFLTTERPTSGNGRPGACALADGPRLDEPQLDGRVAVLFRRLLLDDGAGAGLEDVTGMTLPASSNCWLMRILMRSIPRPWSFSGP